MSFGSDFTVGVEEELLLVSPEPPHSLLAHAGEVLARTAMPRERAGHEAYAAEVELRSPVCGAPAEAVAALVQARDAVAGAGGTLVGAGLHPRAEFGDAELVSTPRYELVRAEMRGLIQRTPECALHVHIGMPDAPTAIRVLNGLRHWLPLLQALSANSPWWFGHDSGMASARWAMVRAYPGRGIPPSFASVDEYEERVEEARRVGGFADYTHLWWDVRPHPNQGTVELREMDAQTESADVAALVGLVQALACREAERPRTRHLSAEALGWSIFRAARDGLQAHVVDDRGDVRPAVSVTRELVGELGAGGRLEPLERLLERGAGADRQRAAVQAGGVEGLMPDLVARSRR